MIATARSLSRGGISYTAIGLSPSTVMGVSRYLRLHIAGVGPDARAEPEAYVDFLLGIVRERGIRLVLPLTDRTLLTCVRFRDAIEAEARLAAPPSAAVHNVLDKTANLDLARSVGVPCPAQFHLEHLEQIPGLIEEIGFPLVLKDPGVATEGERPRLALDWVVVRDERELERRLTEYARQGTFPIVQEYLPELGQRLYCFAARGEIVVAQQTRMLRTLRGRAVYRETIPVTADLHRYTASLLRALEWDGIAGLEFKVRASDGDVRYIETNGRVWAALEGSVGAGWDFPVWVHDYFLHGRLPEPRPPGRGVGKRARWHFGDLQALVRFLEGHEQPGFDGRTRKGAIADYLAGFSPGVHPDVFRWDDPVPELAEHARGARVGAYELLRKSSALRRVIRFLRRRRGGR